jgi:hypothetical protein
MCRGRAGECLRSEKRNSKTEFFQAFILPERRERRALCQSPHYQLLEDISMKGITISVALALVAVTAGAEARTSSPSPTAAVQPSCPAAPAIASTYLRDQVSAGKKLTMSRAAIIADVTKNTGADGEFAGVKPCDTGYASAVHFYIDEVLKAGTNNSTP